MRSGSKWPMIGPWPCAHAIAYVDPVFASQSYEISISMSTRRTNLSVFLVLMLTLMPTQFSLAYTCACACSYACACACACACANAYALAKTRLNQHEGVEFGVRAGYFLWRPLQGGSGTQNEYPVQVSGI